jgi:hypothetical protein
MRAAPTIAPLAAALALATATPAAGPPAPTPVSLPDKGLAWTLPPGWRDVAPQLTGLSEPSQQLAAATFPLHQTTPDSDCAPTTARRQIPPDGVLVMLLEHRDAAGVRSRLRDYPPRPTTSACAAAPSSPMSASARPSTSRSGPRTARSRPS